MVRYLRLLGVQLRASALLSLQYRYEFLIDGPIEFFWAITMVVPLLIVFQGRTSVAGWTLGEALVVSGWFILLQGVLEGAINPSLTSVVEHIRKGTLDFVLLKPADAQFLVSTAKFEPWRAINVLTGIGVFVYAFRLLGHPPSLLGFLSSVLLLVTASMLLYSLWILTVSAAFYVVKVDNLTYLFSSIFDAARWPSSVFRGVLRFVFTFVIPLALMTTYPAQAMLGKHWRAATPEQRKRFVDAFYRSLLNSYGSELVDFTSDRLQILPVTVDPNADHATVRTLVRRNNGDRISVNYQMRKVKNDWKAWDVNIEGISYIKSYHDDFGPQIDQQGLDSVIARLENGEKPGQTNKTTPGGKD